MTESHISYRPDIDGLRAVAVLSVVLFHATGRTGGFVGVDIFFVISGYLISRIIFREVDAADFSVARFYERRIRRIMPALATMIALTALVFAFFSVPIDYKAFGQSVGATAAFSSNVYFYLKSDYFDPSSETAPLLHTWSLAVEEQFYLVFPLLASWLGRVAPARRLGALVIGFAASFLLSVAVVRVDASQAFYLPFTRFWELLIGAIVAVAPARPPRSRRQADILAGVGLLLIVASVLLYRGTMLFPGESALPPCLGAALLIHAGRFPGGRVGALLSLRPVVFVGLISYSLYLWHWPILVGARYVLFRELTPLEDAAALAVMLAAAYASWRWVERPFRQARPGARGRLFLGTAAAGAAAFAFAAAAHSSGGFPQRLPEPARSFAAAALDINPRRAACDRLAVPRIEAGNVCSIGTEGVQPTFAFIGDSFADALMPGMDEAAKRAGVAGYALVHSGCFPLAQVDQGDNGCRDFTDAALRFVAAHPEVTRVVLVARWTSAFFGNRFGQVRGEGWFITDAQSKGAGYAENPGVLRRGLERTLDALAGREVVVIAHIPEQRYDVPRALALHAVYGMPREVALPLSLHETRQAPLRPMFAGLAKAHPFRLLDVGAALCRDGSCPVQSGATVLYADDNHLSRSGGTLLADLFREALQAPT